MIQAVASKPSDFEQIGSLLGLCARLPQTGPRLRTGEGDPLGLSPGFLYGSTFFWIDSDVIVLFYELDAPDSSEYCAMLGFL